MSNYFDLRFEFDCPKWFDFSTIQDREVGVVQQATGLDGFGSMERLHGFRGSQEDSQRVCQKGCEKGAIGQRVVPFFQKQHLEHESLKNRRRLNEKKNRIEKVKEATMEKRIPLSPKKIDSNRSNISKHVQRNIEKLDRKIEKLDTNAQRDLEKFDLKVQKNIEMVDLKVQRTIAKNENHNVKNSPVLSRRLNSEFEKLRQLKQKLEKHLQENKESVMVSSPLVSSPLVSSPGWKFKPSKENLKFSSQLLQKEDTLSSNNPLKENEKPVLNQRFGTSSRTNTFHIYTEKNPLLSNENIKNPLLSENINSTQTKPFKKSKLKEWNNDSLQSRINHISSTYRSLQAKIRDTTDQNPFTQTKPLRQKQNLSRKVPLFKSSIAETNSSQISSLQSKPRNNQALTENLYRSQLLPQKESSLNSLYTSFKELGKPSDGSGENAVLTSTQFKDSLDPYTDNLNRIQQRIDKNILELKNNLLRLNKLSDAR